MSKEKLFSIVALVVLIVGVALYGVFGLKKGGQTAEAQDNVALVNGVGIPRATFNQQLAQATSTLKAQGQDVSSDTALTTIKNQVLDSLINNELINQEITKAGIAPTSAQVDAQYQAIVTQVGGQDKLKTQLQTAGLSDAQLHDNIRKQLAIQMYLQKNIATSTYAVSEKEITDYYNQNVKGQKNAPTLKTIHDQIVQQLTNTKQQAAVNAFVASLRSKAQIQTSL